MDKDNKLFTKIVLDLQKINEKKEKEFDENFSYKMAKAALAGKDKVKIGKKEFPVKMSKSKAKKIVNEYEETINEIKYLLEKKRKKKKKKKTKHIKPTKGEIDYRAKNYGAPPKSKRAKEMARAASLYKQGKVKQAALVRQRTEKKARQEDGWKNKPRPDTKVTENMSKEELREVLEDVKQLNLLDKFISEKNITEDNESYVFEIEDLDEKRKRKKRKKRKKKKSGKSPKGLSAAVKKSLDKKADRRGLTRGSVYAEFRKGLAAFLSSGSRKGMTAHQWAHARVNSANPSKSWAVVKKKKGGKKKKK